MPKSLSKKEAKKSATPAHLPGMFYDKQKKKYFAVRNTNDPSVPYSTGYIKALEAREEREKFEESVARRKTGQVKRSKALETPLAGGLLVRACGARGDNKIDGSAIFARGLDQEDFIRNWTMFSDRPVEPPMFCIIPRPDSDSFRGDVYAAAETGFTTLSWRRDGFERENLNYFPSRISTSISHNSLTKQICATWLSESATSGIAIRSELSSQGNITDNRLRLFTFGPGYSRGGGDVDIFSSTATPESSPYAFVVGTSHGLLGIDKTDYNASYITPDPNNPSSEFAPRDNFALEYLSENPSILLSGGRRGYLNITDFRVPEYGSNADIIYHPSSITHIKSIDCHRVIVAGMQSHLCQYDLRYRKASHIKSTPLPLSSCNIRITLPIVTYPEYHNQASQFLGFDVDVESGIIAAAQENTHHHAIRLFDIQGGHALDSPLLTPPLPAQPVEAPIRCLRFVDDRDRGAKSIWLSQPQYFHRYFWS